MTALRIPTALLIAAAALAVAAPAHAVRVNQRPLLLNRTAVSGYLGAGLPVGEFSDSRDGYGNHADWPLDWAAEIEYFAGRTWSIGFGYASTTYQDKTDPSLETSLSTYTGFVRVVVPTASAVRPYLRAGLGGVDPEFLDPNARYQVDSAFSFQVGGGLIWLPQRWIGLNAQVLYNDGSTYDSNVYGFVDSDGYAVPTIVGFDVQYWSFSGGVSLFFP
ncbi:MAG TPA: outer membrane beta-barrel protein [Candidatus Krumholzibacteria bacterium]|nr:outer membrane beta-barrel protein [Candidatus Krumholzibacteria bacterium]